MHHSSFRAKTQKFKIRCFYKQQIFHTNNAGLQPRSSPLATCCGDVECGFYLTSPDHLGDDAIALLMHDGEAAAAAAGTLPSQRAITP